ncbi:MAG TPA: carbohydrate ABC transporter permease [Aggregatilineales bacterium]|nr:carbohydrate ABC transporter permease [Anaerolineales bacterium]HRE48959.1 carbohydrate ABC transporter permease [Aggregatilineales bacterium]
MTTSTLTPTIVQSVPAGRAALLRTFRITLTYGFLILFALAMIMPFVYSVANSFKTLPDINANPNLLYPTQGVSTDGYQAIFREDFPRWALNSAIIAITVTLTHLILDSMAGYALARVKFPGRGIAFAALVGTMMVPGIVLLVPRYLIFSQLGLLNTYQGLILPSMTGAFGIFLMKQFFESIPADIEEAASIDGCGRFQMFFVIILPLAIPALTALAIFSFQGSWNDFSMPLITVVQKRELWTLQLGLALVRGSTGEVLLWDRLLAGAVITTLPMAVVFFLFQRFFMESATYTAVKG